MTIPDAFDKIANTFHQDTHMFYKTLDDAVRASLVELTVEEMRIAKAYLDELLSRNYSDEQLVANWDQTLGGGGGFGISSGNEGDAEAFLGLIRAALEASLASQKNK
ncbi:hypothetical protein IY145_14490 [Methylosinus sp. H3A]|uniref:hypothetical protein n=1 Tax=Methylosinus sp. H3A TaxID=2785786 RepID=UPI0018C2864C|nr:hypothetical protein [Methylosinus sp. H3A]MBG0810578.1 hypothetical protein [Methylosinus sp. H3A]